MRYLQSFVFFIVVILTTLAANPSPGSTSAFDVSDLIFADSFESGDFTFWSASTTDLGDLSVNPAATVVGNQGLQAVIDDSTVISVTDDSPNAEMRYRARFYFDPNSISMTSGEAHFIFKGFMGTNTEVLRVELRNSSGAYQLRAALINDSAVWTSTSWFTIDDAPHFVELDWRAATSAGIHDGGLTFWIDGAQQANFSTIDNDTWRIDRVRLGALSGIDPGTQGTYYFDAFESRRSTYIGPADGLPVPTSTITATPTASLTPVPAGTIRFAVIGDYGFAGQAEQDVSDLVKSWVPDFVITTGDNNYPLGGADTIDQNIGQYYHEFIHPYGGSYGAGAPSNRFFPAIGNHDWETVDAQPYIDYFVLPGNERYYDFVWGPVHFFAIDSDVHEPDGKTSGSTQGVWLQTQLAASTSPWNLVYMHHPPYSSGATHGSATVMQWPYQAWGADAVLAGHDHTYERIVLNGLPYFVNGLGGRSIYPFASILPGSEVRYNSDYGAMLVEAGASYITFQFITRTGALIDSYTLGTASTPTPTLTATATPTVTVTPTATATSPQTSSLTPTFTPTETGTPTYTATSTGTATSTQTPTSSPTTSISDVLFADGFEAGDLSFWSSSTTDRGDLSVNSAAALIENYGLAAVIDDNKAIYVTDDTPSSELRYRSRFYFDPNSITMASGNAHFIFNGLMGSSTAVVRLEFRFISGAYQIRGRLVNDGSTWTSTSWFDISDASHFIEMDWRASTAAGANNGALTLWIEGTQRASLTGVDNDSRRIDRVRLGAVAGIDTGTRGTYYFDGFESRRQTYIGP